MLGNHSFSILCFFWHSHTNNRFNYELDYAPDQTEADKAHIFRILFFKRNEDLKIKNYIVFLCVRALNFDC